MLILVSNKKPKDKSSGLNNYRFVSLAYLQRIFKLMRLVLYLSVKIQGIPIIISNPFGIKNVLKILKT
jgi:hypothetical protein